MTQKVIPYNPNHLYLFGWSDDLITFEGCLSEELDRYQGDMTFQLSNKEEARSAVVRIWREVGWQVEVLNHDNFDWQVHVNCQLMDGEEEITHTQLGSKLLEVKNMVTEISYLNYIRYDDEHQALCREWAKEGKEE